MRNRLLLRIQQGLIRQSRAAGEDDSSNDKATLSYRSFMQWSAKSQQLSVEETMDVMVAMNVSMCLSIAKTVESNCKYCMIFNIQYVSTLLTTIYIRLCRSRYG